MSEPINVEKISHEAAALEVWAEKVMAEPEPAPTPCLKCGQIPQGQTGEHPCELCGLPTVHDEPCAVCNGTKVVPAGEGMYGSDICAGCYEAPPPTPEPPAQPEHMYTITHGGVVVAWVDYRSLPGFADFLNPIQREMCALVITLWAAHRQAMNAMGHCFNTPWIDGAEYTKRIEAAEEKLQENETRILAILEDTEDIAKAREVLAQVEAGTMPTYPLAEVMARLDEPDEEDEEAPTAPAWGEEDMAEIREARKQPNAMDHAEAACDRQEWVRTVAQMGHQVTHQPYCWHCQSHNVEAGFHFNVCKACGTSMPVARLLLLLAESGVIPETEAAGMLHDVMNEVELTGFLADRKSAVTEKPVSHEVALTEGVAQFPGVNTYIVDTSEEPIPDPGPAPKAPPA